MLQAGRAAHVSGSKSGLAATPSTALPESAAMPFSATSLLNAAHIAAGLTDFGDPTFRDGLAVLLDAIDCEASLNAAGRMAHGLRLTGYLAERLRIQDWYRRHPEIAAERIEGPILIAGLPRTGTTALSHLLAADPDTRSLPLDYANHQSSLNGHQAEVDPDGVFRVAGRRGGVRRRFARPDW
jgi:hypothetical protein